MTRTTDKAQATKPLPAPAEPSPAQSDFARLLAKRLEKSSIFEFRLDPPELGRVEGRLTIGDDGKAALALKFDNQSAFDLFARDEQALRQALVNAGLNFDSGDFVFSFNDRSDDAVAAPAPTPETAASIAADRSYEAKFTAPWSAGALDICV